MDDLNAKVAIVTGASSGVGAAVALGLAARGARVVVNFARSAAEAEAVAAQVRAAGGDAVAVQGDVSRDEDCRGLAAAALARWGRIDILVNNAGATKFVAHGDLAGLDHDDFARIYAVNVIGAFQMVRACRDALDASGDGAVVNVSSIAAMEGVGSCIAYAASKGALNTLTLSLARALAPRIRVNAVCPGYIDSPWFAKGIGVDGADRVREQQARVSPLKRVADGAEIAKSVIFLAGPESRNLTGEVLRSDTGLHLTVAVGDLV